MQNNFLPIILLRTQDNKQLSQSNNNCLDRLPARNSIQICKIPQEYRNSTTGNRIKYEYFIQQARPLELKKQQNLAKYKLKFNDLNDKIDNFFLRHRRERSQSINY